MEKNFKKINNVLDGSSPNAMYHMAIIPMPTDPLRLLPRMILTHSTKHVGLG